VKEFLLIVELQCLKILEKFVVVVVKLKNCRRMSGLDELSGNVLALTT
jgi:hypothetical protein